MKRINLVIPNKSHYGINTIANLQNGIKSAINKRAAANTCGSYWGIPHFFYIKE